MKRLFFIFISALLALNVSAKTFNVTVDNADFWYFGGGYIDITEQVKGVTKGDCINLTIKGYFSNQLRITLNTIVEMDTYSSGGKNSLTEGETKYIGTAIVGQEFEAKETIYITQNITKSNYAVFLEFTIEDEIYSNCIQLRPYVPVSRTLVTPDELSIPYGQQAVVTPKFYPANANCQELRYESKNKSVATVSSDGIITAVGLGKTTISIYADYTYTTITVIVLPTNCTNVTLNFISDTLRGGDFFEFEKNGICYRFLNNNELCVAQNNYSGDIIIPSTVDVGRILPVVSMESEAFRNCSITSIIFPDHLDVRGANICFVKDGIKYKILNTNEVSVVSDQNYSGDIVIPANVTLGNNTYSVSSISVQNCINLTSVTIPNSVSEIGVAAFARCTNLKSVILPETIERIRENAFYDCTKLTQITCFATTPPEIYNKNTFANYNGYLYVSCDNFDEYDVDIYWGSFQHKKCINSENIELMKDEVVVVPEKNEAVFSMPQNEEANTYTLTISSNGVTFCTLTFNSQGQLANIDFSSTKSYELKSNVAGFQFIVTGLSTASEYNYSFKALASNKSVLKEYNGSFTTKNEDGTGGSVHGDGEDTLDVNDVSNTTTVTIVNNQIIVNGEAPSFVITATGQKIANQNLKSGVYFAMIEGHTIKIVIE